MSSPGLSARWTRGLLVAGAAIALILAILTGLARLGWSVGGPPAAMLHGPIFVLGFLGTVIGMERAVAIRRPWAWLVPACSASAVLLLLAGLTPSFAAALLLFGGLGLLGVFVAAHRIQPELHMKVMGLGAVAWVIAAVGLLMGAAVHELVPAMAGFLTLTIVGERVELARLLGMARLSRLWLLGSVGLVLAGSTTALFDSEPGARLVGTGLVGSALWLARNDVARRTVRVPGITRYMASGLIIGYAWLAMAGLLWVSGGLAPGSFSYDAAVHTLFIGFVLSMVFAHAPIIIPALTGLALPFSHTFWLPLALIHASLVLRVWGDLASWAPGRMWGGMLNAVSIGLFALVVVSGLTAGRRRAPDSRSFPRQSTGVPG